jgi:hypothetical protein
MNKVSLPLFIHPTQQRPDCPTPILTSEGLRQLQFSPPAESMMSSLSPKEAFDLREQGEVDTPEGFETLAVYLQNPERQIDAAMSLLKVRIDRLPKSNRLLKVFRACDTSCGGQYGAILPGAYVTELKSQAYEHGKTSLQRGFEIFSTHVYPDELLTLGNPHDFIYIPRNLAIAYSRYAVDVYRQTGCTD